jgi:hypothetical protein
MPDTAPLVRKLEATIPAAIAAAAQDQTIGEAPFAGTVTSVSFTPEANITGQATDYRTFRVINKGLDGNGTTVVASLAFSSAPVAGTDFDEKAITLSVVADATTVAEGDVLAWDETVTGNGLATPGGKVQVEITRA